MGHPFQVVVGGNVPLALFIRYCFLGMASTAVAQALNHSTVITTGKAAEAGLVGL